MTEGRVSKGGVTKTGWGQKGACSKLGGVAFFLRKYAQVSYASQRLSSFFSFSVNKPKFLNYRIKIFAAQKNKFAAHFTKSHFFGRVFRK
jgi:hypothetical protein